VLREAKYLPEIVPTIADEDEIERATGEGAWVEYKFKNPVSGEIEQKINWVRKVDGFIFGSGVYKGE
jgi:signal transduction histidine kinase